MPIYEYICPYCGEEIELYQHLDDPVPMCCGEFMKKQISLSSFRLKGNGWYKTDYQNKKEK